MTEQQGTMLIQTAQSIQQTQQDMSARMEALGRLNSIAVWLLLAIVFLLALRRIVGR